MTKVELVWTTPNGESLIADMARVSAPENVGKDADKLLKYLVKHQHWSPFEMVNLCMEINTTRDIARQILRHRSFSFQEFSQRYADVRKIGFAKPREARMQDTKNRQNSVPCDDEGLKAVWQYDQEYILALIVRAYNNAIAAGIAKEVARSILPEGLTMSKMYMNGTLRSWIHFINLRQANGTQKECQEVALQAKEVVLSCYPSLKEVFDA